MIENKEGLKILEKYVTKRIDENRKVRSDVELLLNLRKNNSTTPADVHIDINQENSSQFESNEEVNSNEVIEPKNG